MFAARVPLSQSIYNRINTLLFRWHSCFFIFFLLKKKHTSHIRDDLSVHSGMQAASTAVDIFCLQRIMGMMFREHLTD